MDTSCVHGGTLTGLFLPEFKIVSVPSRRDYWSETRQKYVQVKSSAQVFSSSSTLQEGWDEEWEQILEKIAALARAESQRILGELQKRPGFSELTPRQLAKAYAAASGNDMPWSAILHLVRKGEINADAARGLFKSDAETRDLLARLSGAGPAIIRSW